MLLFIDHTRVELDFFNLLLDNKGIVLPLLDFTSLPLCPGLLRIRRGGALLRGRTLEFPRA